MGYAAKLPVMSADEFLAWEAAQAERHEFVNGEVFAMAGAEDRHVTVTLNVAMSLRQALAGTPCRTYMTDMKVQPLGTTSFFYPDVLVTCGAADRASALVKHEPRLIVEVLSPATAAYDRGDKFAHYRRIASLEEYALVDLDSRRTDVYRKGSDALWVLHPCEPGQPVLLASVGVTITAAALFAEVDDAPARDGPATA
ncbi:MAG: hypothetical protein ABT20_16965 [Rubrivivax sp. SCN 70-15]|nr:MAG: hypothetical protein ABT20_16965 [Rubrivivax sp. SCN 70-15]